MIDPARARRLADPTHLGLVVLPFLFVGFAGLYGLVTPLWEAPDEADHFAYAAHVLSTGGLPAQRLGERSAAHHPPLYYVVAAAFASPADLGDTSGAFRPDPNFVFAGRGGDHANAALHTTSETFPFRGHALAAHLMRAASAVLGSLTVLFTVLTGRLVVPSRPAIAVLAGALVAFNPQFLFIHGAVNNDAAAGLAGALVAWSTVRAYRAPRRPWSWLLVGGCLGVGVLAKSTLVGLAVVPAVLLVALAAQSGGARHALRGAAAATAGVLLVSGWWLARNVVLTGDPTGYRLYREIWAVNLRATPFAVADLPRMLLSQARSFFGVFGWMNVPGPVWLLAGAAVLFALGTVGALAVLVRDRDAALLLPLGFVAAAELTMLAVALDCNESCWQGRYLFSAAASSAVVVAVGLGAWLPRPATVLIPLAALAALWVPFGVIAPAYHAVPLPKSALRQIEHPLDLRVGRAFQLEGYAVRAGPGARTLVATVYWRSRAVPDFDYSAFVHLLDERGALVAQHDKPPGEGRGYPPRLWWPQDIVRDEHVLLVPAAAGDGPFRLRIGLYNWQTGEQLTVSAGAQDRGTFVVTDTPMALPPGGPTALGG